MAPGQAIVRGLGLITVTVNEQAAAPPNASFAMQFTGVLPKENAAPEVGLQLISTQETTVLLAVTEKFTTAVVWPESGSVAMLAGQLMVGDGPGGSAPGEILARNASPPPFQAGPSPP